MIRLVWNPWPPNGGALSFGNVSPFVGSVSGGALPALSVQVWKCIVSVGPMLIIVDAEGDRRDGEADPQQRLALISRVGPQPIDVAEQRHRPDGRRGGGCGHAGLLGEVV
jgi:hypothetical protein